MDEFQFQVRYQSMQKALMNLRERISSVEHKPNIDITFYKMALHDLEKELHDMEEEFNRVRPRH